MAAYYNEFDPKIAAWLRQLIINGDIAPGEVDERSIVNVQAKDLDGFTQHHFFAGIGVWSYALRCSGWSDTRPVWTASLPCQPFSVAGNQKGKEDDRHLLPHFIELVKQCQPAIIFGEQVEAAIRHGWLDDLYTEMEAQNYAVGSAIIGAHSVNKAHIRQRIYWGAVSRMADSSRNGWSGGHEQKGGPRKKAFEGSGTHLDGLSNSSGEIKGAGASGAIPGCPEWLYCRDNKYRPVKSGIKPLVNGVARGMVYSGGTIDANNTGLARTVRLKGYGNAIVAPLAKAFIGSFDEVIKYYSDKITKVKNEKKSECG